MTSFLLRWQWLLLKRQLFAMPMVIGLIVTAFFQAIVIILALADSNDFTDNLLPFVIYASLMALSQSMTGFSQSLAIASTGLLGIAPIPHHPKVAMVVFQVAVISGINAGLVSLGLGISLLIHGGFSFGALLAITLVFATEICLLAGVGVGLTAFLSRWLPDRLKVQAGVIISPLIFIVIIFYAFLTQYHPNLSHNFGLIFVSMAKHPGQSGDDIIGMLALSLVGVICGMIPFARGFSGLSERIIGVSATDSREAKQTNVPPGLMRLLLWREWILLRRTLGIALLPGVFMLVLFSVMPGGMAGAGYMFLGLKSGAAMFSGIGVGPLPLLYLAPVSLTALWLRRFAILLPQALILAVLYFIVLQVIHHPISVLHEVDNLVMVGLGVSGMSFASFLIPQRQADRKKGRVGQLTGVALLTTVVTSLAPFAIAALNDRLPLPGLILDMGLISGIFVFGPTFLKKKKLLQCQLRSG